MTAVTQRQQTRRQLAVVAVRLFVDYGYDQTTVDHIAAAAGVARRTFFRHYQSKDDVIFPDHDETAAQVESVLRAAGRSEDPLQVICRGIWQVMKMYAAEPELSVTRYHLVRQVPALREHEKAVVSRYERLLARFLLEREGGDKSGELANDDGPLLAEVAAAAVVAAHNHVLRQWLRSGGLGDVESNLDHALSVVRAGLENFSSPALQTESSQVVVAVARTNRDPREVASLIENSLQGE